MIGGWLWDRKITEAQAKKILRDPASNKFNKYAALLLARVAKPSEAIKHYIGPMVFCKHWASIKREMRKDNWNNSRIVFCQVIYEYLLNKYRKKGIVFRKEIILVKDPLCKEAGDQLSHIRREQGLSQKQLAKKIRVSQQLISRIEKGGENVSLITLSNIARALNKKVKVNFI